MICFSYLFVSVFWIQMWCHEEKKRTKTNIKNVYIELEIWRHWSVCLSFPLPQAGVDHSYTLFRIGMVSESKSGERLILSRYLSEVHGHHHLMTTQVSTASVTKIYWTGLFWDDLKVPEMQTRCTYLWKRVLQNKEGICWSFTWLSFLPSWILYSCGSVFEIMMYRCV